MRDRSCQFFLLFSACFASAIFPGSASAQRKVILLPAAQIEDAPVDIAVPQAVEEAAARASQRSTPGTTGSEKPKLDSESMEGVRKRYHEVQTEIARLKNQPAPKPPGDDQLIVVLEHPHLSQGRYRSNNQYDRSFAVRLLFANPTKDDIELKRTGVTLTSDQKTYKVPTSLNNYHDSYSIGQKSYSLSSLKMADVVKIPAGKTASTWAVFGELPMSPAIPDLKLTLDFGKEKREIDVNNFCAGLLRQSVERLGPKNCLAVITIAGQLDPVNLKNLVDSFDELGVKQKLARVIVRWEKDAPEVESNLMSWLQQSANQAGQPRPNNQNNPNNPYPIVPMSIRELHLAELPKSSSRSSSNGPMRIHNTTDEAVIAALRTAYLALPANDIVDDLRHKNPTIRAAALMGGGGRLPPDKLPVLVEFVNSGDRNLERSAIFAMRNFGEEAAITTLFDLVKKNKKPHCTEAAESLATSRFAAASEALLNLLKTAEPDVKQNIVEVLARHPRPIWAETIAEFARKPETPIGMASLRALNGIGHPDLLELLRKTLESDNESTRMEAFNMLAARRDLESEQLALEFTLKHLRTKPLVGQMSNLIIRTKDPRAIPLLIRQFQTNKNNRYSMISTLASIGDESVVDLMVSEYPKLNNSEKRAVLTGLQQLHSEEFIRLAEQALGTKDSSLLNTASDGLYKDGSPRAEQALINALKKEANHSYWRYVCNALVNFGTPAARAALREARESKSSNKKSAAISALRSLQQRSPGNQYIYNARNYVKQENWDLALRYYNLCIESDPEYAAGYAGRGNIYLRQKKYKEAKADFEKAIKADPEDTQGHAGVAIMKILDGKIDEGVKHMETARKQFEKYETNKAMMYYNIACVYGRAIEKLSATPKSDARDKQLKTYQDKAVSELQAGVKSGFNDFELMKKDPDLKSLAELPEFQKLLPKAEAGKKRKRPNLNAGDAHVDEAAIQILP